MPTSMPTMLRPRQEFPTPLFMLVAPLALMLLGVVVAYLSV